MINRAQGRDNVLGLAMRARIFLPCD